MLLLSLRKRRSRSLGYPMTFPVKPIGFFSSFPLFLPALPIPCLSIVSQETYLTWYLQFDHDKSSICYTCFQFGAIFARSSSETLEPLKLSTLYVRFISYLRSSKAASLAMVQSTIVEPPEYSVARGERSLA